MALIFRWYLTQSFDFARLGNEARRVDFQVHCSPAMGAFNAWVKGTELEPWQNRHVDVIGKKLMDSSAEILQQRIIKICGG
jgi:trans-AT polyketide synthase/acyltransferase/oxidoreductase domain-containing protein